MARSSVLCYAQGALWDSYAAQQAGTRLFKFLGAEIRRVHGINSLAHKIVGGYYGYDVGYRTDLCTITSRTQPRR